MVIESYFLKTTELRRCVDAPAGPNPTMILQSRSWDLSC